MIVSTTRVSSAADMMEQLRRRMPQIIDTAELAVAAGAVVAAFFIGQFIGRMIGKRIAAFLDLQTAEESPRYEHVLRAASKIMRYIIMAALLGVVRFAWDWQLYSELIVGAGMAAAVALAAQALLRALRIGFWTAIAASAALFSILFSAVVGGLTPVSNLLDQASFQLGTYRFSLLTLVSAVLIGIFLVAGVRLANNAVKLLLGRNKKLDGGQRLLGEKLALVALVIAAFFIGIDLLGIDLTAFAVFSGAFGLAIGFGLQKTFGNLIAGIILLMDRSIKPGDVIAVGDSFGSVNKIGVRAVSVLTRDGIEHLIPNENLMTNEVQNWSFSSRDVRVKIPIGVSYASDMKVVEELLLRATKESPRVQNRPAPAVWMAGFGDNGVNFEIQAWIVDPEEGVGNVRSDVLKRVWWLFKEHGIEIPFPQREVHLRGNGGGIAGAGTKAKAEAKPKKAASS
jgi:potassium-dependent mechanosensitive channel